MNTLLAVLPTPPSTTVQATALDAVTADGVLTFTNINPMVLANLRSMAITASVAETVQVTTTTFTASASLYEFTLAQLDISTGKTFFQKFSYTATSADTATTIGNAFRAQINACTAAGILKINATGTTTLIMTAITRYPIFTQATISAGGGSSVAATTPGVRSVGLAADVTLQYSQNGQSLPTGGALAAAYTTYTFDCGSYAGNAIGDMIRNQEGIQRIFVSTSATNYAALAARLVEIKDGLPSGGSTYSDPEILARPAAASN